MINNARHQQLEINDGEQPCQLAAVVENHSQRITWLQEAANGFNRRILRSSEQVVPGLTTAVEELSAIAAELIHQQQRVESAVTWLQIQAQGIAPGQPVTWKLAIAKPQRNGSSTPSVAPSPTQPRRTGMGCDPKLERQYVELYRQCWIEAGADGSRAVATAVNAAFMARAVEAGLPQPLSRWVWEWRALLSFQGMLIRVPNPDGSGPLFATYWVKGDE